MPLPIGPHTPSTLDNPFNIDSEPKTLQNQFVNSLQSLWSAGIRFSPRQLAVLSKDQMDVIYRHLYGLIELKKVDIKFSAQHLVQLTPEHIMTIGLYYWVLTPLIRAGLPFPWNKLPEVDADALDDAIRAGIGVKFAIKEEPAGTDVLNVIMRNNQQVHEFEKAAIDLQVRQQHAINKQFVRMDDCGINFSDRKLRSQLWKRLEEVGNLAIEFSSFKLAGVEFDGDDLLTLTPSQLDMVEQNANALGLDKNWNSVEANAKKIVNHQQDGLPLSWNVLIDQRLEWPR